MVDGKLGCYGGFWTWCVERAKEMRLTAERETLPTTKNPLQ